MATEEEVESVETHGQKIRRRKYADMYISREVIFSEAFRKLSGTAIRMYLIFLNKRVMKPFQGSKKKRSGKAQYFIENQGQIQFTYDEGLEKYGIIEETFRNNLNRLVEVGLIDITRQGNGVKREKSLYAISDRWELFGTEDFVAAKRAIRPQQYGFTKGNTLGKNARKENLNTGFIQ